MAVDPDRIFQDALQLPQQDRAVLAGRLIESLEDETDDGDVAPAWAEEIARRLREIDDGKVTSVPWEEARRQIRE
jgi:putative addiction module component (TIGR02574 family)